MIDQLATEMSGRLRVAQLNIDDNPLTASRFQVQSIPTLLVFQGGREVDRLVGALPKAEIVRRLSGVGCPAAVDFVNRVIAMLGAKSLGRMMTARRMSIGDLTR